MNKVDVVTETLLLRRRLEERLAALLLAGRHTRQALLGRFLEN